MGAWIGLDSLAHAVAGRYGRPVGAESEGPDDFLSRLADEDREALFVHGGRRRFSAGGTIMYERQVAEEVFVLLSGRVKVAHITPEGREIVLNFCGPGEMIGEMAVIDSGTRSVTIEALEPVEALAIPAARFRAMLETHPRIAVEILSAISRRVVDASRRQIEFAGAQVLGRVASRILELSERYGEVAEDGGVVIALPISQAELAGWVGSSREAVSQALHTLRELGVIATERRRIVVRDVEALRRQSATT
jgi:CRP/FNR family transcriptional regulator, cyclic AMP receptor protein